MLASAKPVQAFVSPWSRTGSFCLGSSRGGGGVCTTGK